MYRVRRTAALWAWIIRSALVRRDSRNQMQKIYVVPIEPFHDNAVLLEACPSIETPKALEEQLDQQVRQLLRVIERLHCRQRAVFA